MSGHAPRFFQHLPHPRRARCLSPRFYEEGYKDGLAHGRIHGLIEGRALGREKGFEMWEELGFYEGFALMWKAILDAQGAQDE